MEATDELAKNLVNNPRESLNLEVKRWLNPTNPDGQAKIVKALLALRNRDGGALIVGFDNDTLLPDAENRLIDCVRLYHQDVIQELVSRYASEPFEITVKFGDREGLQYPVISVPSGVRVVVALKSDLKDSKGATVGHRGDVFVRSLHSNGRVSTTKARPEDWRDLLELCFNNREADIGAFFRRQLSGAVPSTLHDILAGLLANRSPKTTRPTEIAYNLLERGTTARNAAVEIRRRVDPDALGFIQLGTWDVALAVLGELPRRLADREFLNLISSSNPDYTGWPVWLDSRTFSNERNRPQVRQDGWEALIVSKEEWLSNHADFIRIEPPSSFYLSRVIPDDLVEKSKGIRPGSVFDANLHTYRTAEAIAVGLAFGRALTTALESTTLVFVFRWTKLRHRKLGVWANPLAYGPGGAEAIDDEVTTDVEVPLETVPSAIAPFVHSVMRHVVAKFDGYVYPLETVEQLVSNLVARRR